MRSLVRFADQLSFEIASVVDIPPSKLKGLDAGEAIGAEPIGASVQLVLEEALDGVDTLVIGHLDAYSEAKAEGPITGSARGLSGQGMQRLQLVSNVSALRSALCRVVRETRVALGSAGSR